MECQHLDDLYELYLLGALVGRERDEIHEHLARGCPYCSDHLRQASLSVYFLSASGQRTRVPSQIKTRVLRRLGRKS